MALPKLIKVGGSYYSGYKCAVSSATGGYILYIDVPDNCAMNSLSLTPDQYGANDTMKLEHYTATSGGGPCLAVIAENLYNIGKSTTINLDFPCAEKLLSGQSLKFTYTNTSTTALNVYLICEYLGYTKTA